MSIDSRTQAIDATGQLRLANANFIFLITASAAVTVVLNRGGSSENFANAIAGLRVARVRKWDYAFITGAPGTIVNFFYGITEVREDATDVQQSIATIAGTVSVALLPGATLTDTADTAQATATQTAIGANLARRRITIGVRSDGNEPVRVSFSGGAGRGIEISPGTYQEFQTTAALVVRNDNTFGSGLGTTWYAEEEA